ncbi:MAG: hypothetical protein AAF939_01950 [Planctomycetota bacterium]
MHTDENQPIDAEVEGETDVETPLDELDPEVESTAQQPIQPGHDFAPVSVAPPVDSSLENLSANGGAVGGLVLGAWCIAGSFFTNWSVINGLLGFPLACWGINYSRKKKSAIVGLILCLIGIGLCMVQVSEWLNFYFNTVEESDLPF